MHKIQRIFFWSSSCAAISLTTWQWTVRFHIDFHLGWRELPQRCLFDYLMMELKKRESGGTGGVYKVISRRIIKHHEMILECFSRWCLASTSFFFCRVAPFKVVINFYSWNRQRVLMRFIAFVGLFGDKKESSFALE